MGKITLRSKFKTIIEEGKETRIRFLDNEKFEKFNLRLLGLGDISLPSTQVEAIAAMFDLTGFTHFCSQVDPDLAVPEYLSRFLGWLFDAVKEQFVAKSYKGGKELWADLPFLGKFMGDGVLFLWNTKNMSKIASCNVVVALWNICVRYKSKFYPEIKKRVAEPPNALRCGIARGRVFSVGNGQDYVGPCINIASRLQKLSLLTFCISRRGFDFAKHMVTNTAERYLLKCVSLPGIGGDELVWVKKKEFDSLPEEEKALFREP